MLSDLNPGLGSLSGFYPLSVHLLLQWHRKSSRHAPCCDGKGTEHGHANPELSRPSGLLLPRSSRKLHTFSAWPPANTSSTEPSVLSEYGRLSAVIGAKPQVFASHPRFSKGPVGLLSASANHQLDIYRIMGGLSPGFYGRIRRRMSLDPLPRY